MPPHLSFRLATAESVHNSHRVILVLLGSLMALVAACRGLNFRSYMNRNSNGGCEGTLALGSKCCSKDWDVEKLFGKPKFRESSETDVKSNHLARQLPVGLFLHPHGASFNDKKTSEAQVAYRCLIQACTMHETEQSALDKLASLQLMSSFVLGWSTTFWKVLSIAHHARRFETAL